MARKRPAKQVDESDSEFGIFNVERIVAKKTDHNVFMRFQPYVCYHSVSFWFQGKVFYLIKWEGYPSSQNTWESEENVFSEALIKDFEDREKSKVSNLDDEFTPSKSPIRTPISPRRSPLKNQRPQVVSAKTVTRDPDTEELNVHCIMYSIKLFTFLLT